MSKVNNSKIENKKELESEDEWEDEDGVGLNDLINDLKIDDEDDIQTMDKNSKMVDDFIK